MNKAVFLASGVGVGGGLMYLFDPSEGRRRRALIRDKAVRLANETDDAVRTTARDINNRAQGIAAGARSLVWKTRKEEVSDDVLAARVKSKIGRVASHPHAIDVVVWNERVTLRGPVLAKELPRLIRAVSSVPGVGYVANELEVHESSEDVPSLQGGSERYERPEWLQTNWSPAARLVAGAAGGALAAYGIKNRNLIGAGAMAVGLGMIVRGVSNKEASRLFGLADRARGC